MSPVPGRGSKITVLLASLVLPWSACALDMATMLVDSLSAHPEVKEKMHSYRRIVQDQVIAESGWRPSVDLNATTGVYETESPTTNNESVDYDSSTIELALTQNLFNGYDTTFQQEQTKARATAALYDVYDVADNIALRAVQAYLEVLKQRRLYYLAIENVQSHEEILAQIRERDRSGVGRRSQLQQTEGRVARAHASLIAQQNNLLDSASQLHEILGRYVDPEDLLEPRLPDLPTGSLDDLIDDALRGHPAMRVAEGNIQAAQADYKRSLRTKYPNVDLRVATEYGDDIDGLDGETEETSIVLNFSYNFYSGGRNQAESQQKINIVYEQKEFAARTRRQIINTLRLSWTADTSIAQQIKFLELHIIKADETAESYREEFFIGQRDLLDLLDAKNELNNARNQHARAKFDGLIARYRVYEGIGQLLQVSDVGFDITEDRLRVARLTTENQDRLPIPTDEDQDKKHDPLDQCDNSVLKIQVNPYGCLEPINELGEATASSFNSTPLLGAETFEVETNGVLVITEAQLLANDQDVDGDDLEITDISQPETGKLAYTNNGDLIYRPAEGFIGTDKFSYTVSDTRGAWASTQASVNIKVRQALAIDLDKVQLVNFVYDEAELTDVSKQKVEAIIARIKEEEGIQVEIRTYTDNIGSDGYNINLSLKRANALRTLLIEEGIDEASIDAIGMGEANPIADNGTEAGQAINRRGEFTFRRKSSQQ